ncbi:formylmethanofuran dehydrogenase subunit E region [Thermodesulfatator indicus DSM 15286]|uniref:Formylmethanofuran dehydrogenase subunit E region n=1 Tax=Thermodesulfatator indicus (strain DSM 15286 / JCM 11887 / CIR29812) TaxID=667014 RepID=F8A9H5_THEID|nr:FmdE family protein [Thermodesulfatator indicus]AEH44120.1 formylmethanofuran dehydrogenase subunit E region [Thermodesulfatator indicus DSM 15286]
MALEIKDPELAEMFAHGVYFHGHLCPAMPMGLRAGLIARKRLGVERAKSKELMLLSETGTGHLMQCFLDGVMMATGCTYGKGNCQKLYYNKMAFVLIDVVEEKAVRVAVRAEFIKHALEHSPFMKKRQEGIPPEMIEPEIAEAAVNKVLTMPEEELFNISDVYDYHYVYAQEGPPEFCTSCGEVVFGSKARVKKGKIYCIPCSGYKD